MRIIISSLRDIENRKSELRQSAVRTKEQLLALASSKDAISLLADMKFEKVGCDPLESKRQLNLIEQLHQTFTYLASFLATEYLLKKYPSAKPFILNLGTSNGLDIKSSKCGGIGAEVFAAVNPKNNDKLIKDCKKISSQTGIAHKYVFFMCPGFKPGRQEDAPQFPDVSIVAVSEEYI